MSLNKVIVLGRIGKIEQKFMPNGKTVVNFSIATSESWIDQQGQKQEKTEWINFVAFDKKAEAIFQYFQKGSEIYAEGKFTTRKWQDQSGQDHWTTEVQLREFSFTGGSKVGDQSNQQRQQPQQNNQQPSYPNFDDMDNDIPF